ncbi:hypothetical protein [Spirosoma oryzicola]|uniref:hypothetical protein n=1 Tax=Spirosoma oryzicola TaxID=2898794 RepID=UPI001E2DE7BA|nr:hypothetical protein [Spirosoma oryzicola]UHG93299.1 hypothetical protein LQ777_10440 [Spirosoma oryzicola]
MENLIYLTELLPKSANVSSELVKRLNDSGLKPKRKSFYTDDIVKNTLSGKTIDLNVKKHLMLWVLEMNSTDVIKERLRAIRKELKIIEEELMQPLEA